MIEVLIPFPTCITNVCINFIHFLFTSVHTLLRAHCEDVGQEMLTGLFICSVALNPINIV